MRQDDPAAGRSLTTPTVVALVAGLAHAASLAWPWGGAAMWWLQLASMAALAWLVSALAALATVLVTLRVRSPGPLVGLWLLGAGATVFVAVTGNVTVGLNHDWATDAMALACVAGVLVSSGAVAVVATAAAGVDPGAGLPG